MASRAESPLFDSSVHAARWIADYCGQTHAADVLCAAQTGGDDSWALMFEELANLVGDNLDAARERAQRQAEDIGTGFRIIGESDERPWPLSPVPLLLQADEWREIEAGIVQRAGLMEAILSDIYGEAKLVSGGLLPAAVVTGSPYFLRPMVGLEPSGGTHLQFFAADLCRGPTGEWRVLADHLRAPTGAGYALENRLALSRVLGGLQSRLNIERHAPFFAAFRDGLAALCKRSDPRIGLLTPGRYNQSYTEQAHLARYLGLLLVEGGDLAVHEERVYVRTIAGLKRIDALWRRIDPRMLDPLAFDSHSTIGVPGLIDAMAAGNVVIANAPGAGVLEAPAMAAFLPRLATRLLGESLKLPNIATWWCGQPAECARVLEDFDRLVIGPAFGPPPLGLPGGEALLGSEMTAEAQAAARADISRRPQDYVGQEVVRLSTMPVVSEGVFVSRPFTLRVFAARDAQGNWAVLPGGFARIAEHPDMRAAVMGEGTWSADVIIHGREPVDAVSLIPADDEVAIRRNPGTLPSRVADNLFWLGRYLERGEALLGLIRALLGNSIDADTGAALGVATVSRLAGLIVDSNAAPAPPTMRRADLVAMARTAMESLDVQSVRAINRHARGIGSGSRDRLAADMIRLLDAPFPARGALLDRAGTLQRRYMALAGLSAEHMGRTAAWRFHDLGRRIERAMTACRAVRAFGGQAPTADDLSTLLDLANSQISYRQRYLTGLARAPVIDLVALDPSNPRAIAFQVSAIAVHLRELPALADDGMAESQQVCAAELFAMVSTMSAPTLVQADILAIERKLAELSDAVARRYFLQGAEPLRAGGLTLA